MIVGGIRIMNCRKNFAYGNFACGTEAFGKEKYERTD